MVDLSKIALAHPVDTQRVVLTQGFGETRYFDYRRFGYPGHNGVDFAPHDGRIGEQVAAAEGGVVVTATYDSSGYGRVVKVDHGGYSTLYAHLDYFVVKAGDLVERGQVLGYMGNTGNSTGVHLHFELRVPGHGVPGYGQSQRDPLPFFAALNEQPAVPVDQVAPAAITEGKLAKVKSSVGANVRLSPSTDGLLVGALPYKTPVGEILAVQDGWAAIRVWIYADLLSEA